MKSVKSYTTIVVEILLVLLLSNYMIVTIILKDAVYVKYLRDILLIVLLIMTAVSGKIKIIPNIWLLGIFSVFVVVSISRATSISTGITAARRYIFPVLFYVISYHLASKKSIRKLMHFILPMLAILSIWGIFQAYVLKDEFLKRIGYPQVLLPAYGRLMLNQAFYFGDFGIQRVTSTMSSPNIFALILGMTGIFLIVNRSILKSIKHWKFYLGMIILGYVLTVSRSNFVALAIVGIMYLIPHIPHKRRWFGILLMMLILFVVVGLFQGQQGMLHKLINWVSKSLTFKESSAAGRSERWLSALRYVIHNPLGLGPGYVGSIATNAGKQALYFDAENSYLCLALDAGWMAVIAYYSFYIKSICQARKREKSYSILDNELVLLNKTAYTLIIYIMIVMFFSNHVQDMEPTSFLFLYLGLINGYTARSKDNVCNWFG